MDKKYKLSSERQVRFVLWYLIIVSLIKFTLRDFNLPDFSAVFSYVGVFIILFLIMLYFYGAKGTLIINTEIIVSFALLLMAFIFTFFSSSFIASILAIGINLFLLYTSIIANNTYLSEYELLRICKNVVSFAIIVVMIALIKDKPFSQLASLNNAYRFEFVGIWNSKNQFGRFLFCACACNLYILIYQKRNHNNNLKYLISFFLLSICVVFSFSRAALLALVVLIGLYILISNKHNLRRNIFVFLLLFVLIFALYHVDAIKIFVNSFVIRKETATINNRSVLWKIGIDYFKSHVFWGSGEYMAENILKSNGSTISEFHNAYVNRLVVSGLFGFALYAILFFRRIRLLLIKNKNDYFFLSISLFFAVLAYMMFESFEIYTFSLDSFLIMIFMYLIPNARYNDDEDVISNNKHNCSSL